MMKVLKDGKPFKDYYFNKDLRIFATKESGLTIVTNLGFITFRTGSDCSFDTGSYCIFITNFNCSFKNVEKTNGCFHINRSFQLQKNKFKFGLFVTEEEKDMILAHRKMTEN